MTVHFLPAKQGMIPREDNASDHVLEALKPYTKENGGPLEVERVHFTPGRGNVVIKYEGVFTIPYPLMAICSWRVTRKFWPGEPFEEINWEPIRLHT